MARGGNPTSTRPAILAGFTLPPELSAVEQAQLGTVRRKQNGQPSSQPWPTAEQWPQMRELLVARSLRANPELDPELTAYTPGETLQLLDHPQIASWHAQQAHLQVPAGRTIILVPCAKTKPWTGPRVGRSRLYSAYHQLLSERDDLHFITLSEPLGTVSMERWSDFPQYDNPGLFVDNAQRSGMHLKDWRAAGYDHAYSLPFDKDAQAQCISRLGSVIADVLARHSSHRIVSFVDDSSSKTTHAAMLDEAIAASAAIVERRNKRSQARVSPLDHMRALLA